MSGMIEKVAQAIYDQQSDGTGPVSDFYQVAYAAVKAMQDPTGVMIEAGVSVDWDCDGDEHAAAVNVWHAMHRRHSHPLEATMATEQEYDDIIAPLLADVANKAALLGMSFIARVEWEPGESGITQIGPMTSAGQVLTLYAAHSHGNIDSMLIGLLKTGMDCSQSMFLRGCANPAAKGGAI